MFSDHCYSTFIRSTMYIRKARKRNARHTDWEGSNKTFFFSNNMIVFVENPKKSTTKLLELISEFSKAT